MRKASTQGTERDNQRNKTHNKTTHPLRHQLPILAHYIIIHNNYGFSNYLYFAVITHGFSKQVSTQVGQNYVASPIQATKDVDVLCRQSTRKKTTTKKWVTMHNEVGAGYDGCVYMYVCMYGSVQICLTWV